MSTLTVPIRIKRGVGTPSTLKQGELAFDENGQRLFVGSGVGSGGNAAAVVELTTPPALLEQLQDVVFASEPNDGDVLTYDGDAGEWISQAITAANIGAAAASHTHAASDITSGLATVATTGAYSDLSGTPTLGTAAYLDTTDFVESQAASTFGLSLLDDADAAAARTTLGLGSAATVASTAFADVDHSHEW